MNYAEISKETFSQLYSSYGTLKDSPLDATIRGLVELRVSQMNGCAYCCKAHSKDAREAGASDKQLDELCAWRTSSLFDEKQRIALEWAETLTTIDSTTAPSAAYLKEHFSDREIVDLTLSISLMNAFNRIAVSLKH